LKTKITTATYIYYTLPSLNTIKGIKKAQQRNN